MLKVLQSKDVVQFKRNCVLPWEYLENTSSRNSFKNTWSQSKQKREVLVHHSLITKEEQLRCGMKSFQSICIGLDNRNKRKTIKKKEKNRKFVLVPLAKINFLFPFLFLFNFFSFLKRKICPPLFFSWHPYYCDLLACYKRYCVDSI